MQSVNKMLSPEEMTLLENIQANIGELIALQGATEQTQGPEQVEESGDSKILEGLKAMAGQPDTMDEEANKSNDGPTSNEDAETRLEQGTEITENNKSEVGKALAVLASLFAKKEPVKKSNDMGDMITKSMAAALKPIVERLEEHEKFNNNILESLGFSKKIEKSLKTENKSTPPIISTDAETVLKQLIESINSVKKQETEYANDWNGHQQARKNLNDAMPFIFAQSLKGNR